jgi:hypothetical protein
MKVAVIGGRGFFGSSVTTAFERSGAQAKTADRRGADGVTVDVSRPETFEALAAFDVVVNCSDSVRAPSRDILSWHLRRGGLFIEASADLRAIEAALTMRQTIPASDSRGTVLLGMGIAPGLSNLLAAEASRSSKPERLVIGLRVSSFSAGGGGMAQLMAEALAQNAVYFDRGDRKEEPAASFTADLPFADGSRTGLRISLPESAMLARSMGVPSISTFLVPEPAFVRHLVRGAARFSGPAAKWALARLFTVQRSMLFRHVMTSMEICVLADARARWLHATDGIAAGAAAIVAAAQVLAGRPPPPGIVLPDECLTLDEVVARVRRAGCDVHVDS